MCKVLFIRDNGNWSRLLSGCIHYLRGAFNPSLTSHLRLLMRCWPKPLFLVFLLLHLPFLWERRRTPADVISPRQVPFLPFSTSARIHTNPISSHLGDISHVGKHFFFFSKAAKHFECNHLVSVSADTPSPRWRHPFSISARSHKL